MESEIIVDYFDILKVQKNDSSRKVVESFKIQIANYFSYPQKYGLKNFILLHEAFYFIANKKGQFIYKEMMKSEAKKSRDEINSTAQQKIRDIFNTIKNRARETAEKNQNNPKFYKRTLFWDLIGYFIISIIDTDLTSSVYVGRPQYTPFEGSYIGVIFTTVIFMITFFGFMSFIFGILAWDINWICTSVATIPIFFIIMYLWLRHAKSFVYILRITKNIDNLTTS